MWICCRFWEGFSVLETDYSCLGNLLMLIGMQCHFLSLWAVECTAVLPWWHTARASPVGRQWAEFPVDSKAWTVWPMQLSPTPLARPLCCIQSQIHPFLSPHSQYFQLFSLISLATGWANKSSCRVCGSPCFPAAPCRCRITHMLAQQHPIFVLSGQMGSAGF